MKTGGKQRVNKMGDVNKPPRLLSMPCLDNNNTKTCQLSHTSITKRAFRVSTTLLPRMQMSISSFMSQETKKLQKNAWFHHSKLRDGLLNLGKTTVNYNLCWRDLDRPQFFVLKFTIHTGKIENLQNL